MQLPTCNKVTWHNSHTMPLASIYFSYFPFRLNYNLFSSFFNSFNILTCNRYMCVWKKVQCTITITLTPVYCELFSFFTSMFDTCLAKVSQLLVRNLTYLQSNKGEVQCTRTKTLTSVYSKTCLKLPLKRTKICFSIPIIV